MAQIAQRYPVMAQTAWFLALLSLLVLLGRLGAFMYGDAGLEDYHKNLRDLMGRYYPFFLIFFFPWIETLLFQALPGVIGQIFIPNKWLQWAVMAVPFGLAHYDFAAVPASLFHGLCSGMIFGYVYWKYMQQSHLRAMLLTWLLHAASNSFGVWDFAQ